MIGSLKTVKKSIAGGELTVTQFPVTRAIRVGVRVAKLASPILGGAAKGLNLDDLLSGNLGEKLQSMDVKLGTAVPGALASLAEVLQPDDFLSLVQALLESSVFQRGEKQLDLSQPGAIDAAFGGSIPDLFAALKASFEANDFFGLGAIGKLRGLLGVSVAPGKTNSPAVSTQT